MARPDDSTVAVRSGASDFVYRMPGHALHLAPVAAHGPVSFDALVQVLGHASVGLALVGRDLRYHAINDALAAINGLPARDHLGRTIPEVLPALAGIIAPIVAQVFETGVGIAGLEFEGIPQHGADRSPRMCRAAYQPVWGAGGEVSAVAIVVEETTLYRRNEEKLREHADRFRRVLDGLGAMAGLLSPEGVIMVANASALAFLEAPEDAILGLGFADAPFWSHDADARRKVGEALAAARRGETVRYDTTVTVAGGIVPVDMQVSPVFGIGGDVEAIVVSGVDILARKTAEEQRELLLAELDHRVKNVLAVIQAVVAQSSRNATSASDLGRRLQGRIAALAHAHNQLVATRFAPADLGQLVETELRPHQSRDGARLAIGGPGVSVRPAMAFSMSLLVHELATNAVKYGALGPMGGHLTVRWAEAWEDGTHGLVFTWKERDGPAVATPGREGFGSELIRHTVERALAGRLTIAFAPEGFELSAFLPLDRLGALTAPEPATPAAAPARPGRFGGVSVLVVEDSALVSLDLALMLEREGATVVGPAATVAEALEMAADAPIDVALLDINLNGQMSFPVAERLAARNIPFAFTTGYEQNLDLPDAVAAHPVIRKPFSDHAILAGLARILSEAQAAA